jgi:hypothetical protein
MHATTETRPATTRPDGTPRLIVPGLMMSAEILFHLIDRSNPFDSSEVEDYLRRESHQLKLDPDEPELTRQIKQTRVFSITRTNYSGVTPSINPKTSQLEAILMPDSCCVYDARQAMTNAIINEVVGPPERSYLAITYYRTYPLDLDGAPHRG